MASATVNRVEPVTPPPSGVTLELSIEEAQALFSVLSAVSVSGTGKITYKIFNALYDTKVLEMKWLSPKVFTTGFGNSLITFEEDDK
jgi:hypothetical protein